VNDLVEHPSFPLLPSVQISTPRISSQKEPQVLHAGVFGCFIDHLPSTIFHRLFWLRPLPSLRSPHAGLALREMEVATAPAAFSFSGFQLFRTRYRPWSMSFED
jgi:hypothetical protein